MDPSDDKGRWEIFGVKPGSYMVFAFGESAVPNIGKQVQVVDKDVNGRRDRDRDRRDDQRARPAAAGRSDVGRARGSRSASRTCSRR